MSGGSHNYIYCRIEEELCGQMEDKELNDLIADIVQLAHDLEWYHSSDTSREDYVKSVRAFKEKWFKQSRTQRLRNYVDKAVDELREELIAMIGETDSADDSSRHGRWLKRMSTPDSLKCSVCGNNHERPTTECPNCGAIMDKERYLCSVYSKRTSS